jgi:hypothetical protein
MTKTATAQQVLDYAIASNPGDILREAIREEAKGLNPDWIYNTDETADYLAIYEEACAMEARTAAARNAFIGDARYGQIESEVTAATGFSAHYLIDAAFERGVASCRAIQAWNLAALNLVSED